jgi:hypothetical protein
MGAHWKVVIDSNAFNYTPSDWEAYGPGVEQSNVCDSL